MWLLLLLIAVPIVEIALFIEVGGWLGLWPTLGIVILTAVIGTVLLRIQGIGALRRLQESLDGAGDPRGALAHGAMILVAGVLLLTPGFFTDAVGFLLLTPPFRSFVIRTVGARMAVHVRSFGARTGPARPDPGGTVIDGEYEHVTPEDRPGGRPSGWTRIDQ